MTKRNERKKERKKREKKRREPIFRVSNPNFFGEREISSAQKEIFRFWIFRFLCAKFTIAKARYNSTSHVARTRELLLVE